ncbi:MAG TPA: MarR family transcriptional regulator [Gaiellaceae bacterium]|nr:MarR family transcriptional regulator [Gaiellaceae bacterium]
MTASSNDQPARGRPPQLPIGRQLHLTAKAVGHAFGAALAEAGGSISTWLVLSALEHDRWRSQHDLAAALGIEGPTLTRHLDALESAGLVVRVRDASDRRAVRVEATDAGRTLHQELFKAAKAFDRRLRAGFSDEEIDGLRVLLERLEENAGPRFRAAPRQMP